MALRRLRSGRGKSAAAALAALALTVTLTACGGDGNAGSDGSGRQQITVAALPLVDDAPLYLARDRGLFRKEGLDVRIQPVQQSIQALPALAKGQVDVIASANYVTYLQTFDKGTLDVRILAEGARVAPHMMDVLVAKDSAIKSVSDLKGKKVAVAVLNNIQSLTLNAVLDERGAGRPVYRQIPFAQMGAALQKGEADAVHAVEPFDSALQRDIGARVLVDGASSPVRFLPVSGYVTTQRFADKNPKAAAAFRRAIAAASALATRSPDAVRQELPKYAKVTAEQATSLHLPLYPAATDAEQLRRLIRLMRQQGMLSKDIDPAAVVVK